MSLLLDVLVRQLARPQGALSRVIAPLLDRSNHTINLHVAAALNLAPSERVLEVGFGGGVGLATLLAHEPLAVLSGVELSPEMVLRSQRRFGDKVRLAQGSVDAMPYAEGSFDKLFGVNVIYFWPDLPRALSELRRVLVPGGLVVLGIRPPEARQRLQFAQAGHRVWSPAQYVEALAAAGFAECSAQRVPDPEGAYLVRARRA